MEINIIKDSDKTTVQISGRIDTVAYEQFSSKMDELLNDSVNQLIVDFTNVEYVSSSALRVLLKTHKAITQKYGKMVLKTPNLPFCKSCK